MRHFRKKVRDGFSETRDDPRQSNWTTAVFCINIIQDYLYMKPHDHEMRSWVRLRGINAHNISLSARQLAGTYSNCWVNSTWVACPGLLVRKSVISGLEPGPFCSEAQGPRNQDSNQRSEASLWRHDHPPANNWVLQVRMNDGVSHCQILGTLSLGLDWIRTNPNQASKQRDSNQWVQPRNSAHINMLLVNLLNELLLLNFLFIIVEVKTFTSKRFAE